MKKLVLFLSLLCLPFANEAKAIEPISMTLVSAIALPLAKAAWDALMSESDPKTCRPECFQGGNYCTKGLRYRNYRECKGTCQRIVQHGDYQLRVRFYKTESGSIESLLNCAQVGGIASGRDKLGKEKKNRAVELSKSIAVYSPDDLEHLLYYVLKHKFAKIVSVSNEEFLLAQFKTEIDAQIKNTGSTNTPAEFIKLAIKDAMETMRLLELQIEDLRKNGLFGPQ